MNKNLYRLLAAHFPDDKAAACMILPDGRVWTYGDVERASARIARLIVALGLKPGAVSYTHLTLPTNREV